MPPVRHYRDCKDGKDGTLVVEATSIVIHDFFDLQVRVIHSCYLKCKSH